MKNTLDMKSIFRCMMEEGYYPKFEKTHILFELDGNTAIVEHEDGIVSIRIFFSIEPEAYDLFLEASNAMMMDSYIVKPVVLDDMENIMFSLEMMCDNIREFRKFLPRAVAMLVEALMLHKAEMKKLILSEKVSSATISAAEDTIFTSSKGRKPLS